MILFLIWANLHDQGPEVHSLLDLDKLIWKRNNSTVLCSCFHQCLHKFIRSTIAYKRRKNLKKKTTHHLQIKEQKRCYSAEIVTSLEKYNLSLYQNSRHLVFNFWLVSCWTLVFFHKNSKISLVFRVVLFCSRTLILFIRSSNCVSL